MSHGAFVHADRLERQTFVERQQAERRELWERRRQWAAEHMPDLPAEKVLLAIGQLEFGRCELTDKTIREYAENALLRFYTPAELATMKANGGKLPDPERTSA